MEMMEPLVTQLPYMTLIGNHERDWPDTGDRYLNGVRDSGTPLPPGEPFAHAPRGFSLPIHPFHSVITSACPKNGCNSSVVASLSSSTTSDTLLPLDVEGC